MVQRLAQVWFIEFLKGTGKIFLHPLFYYLIIFAIIIGIKRVKRERAQFHTRVNHALSELLYLFRDGLLIGVTISIIMIAVGAIIPFAAIVLFTLVTIILSLSTKLRLVTPAYIVGFSFFVLIIMANQTDWTLPVFQDAFTSLEKIYPAVALLLALLLFAEAVLIMNRGAKDSSPKLAMSRRGQRVGMHEINRLWMVPVFLLVPGGVLQIPFPWWPIFSIGDQTYSLFLVPFAIGFFQQCKGNLPKKITRTLGKRMLIIAIITLLIVVSSYFYPLLAIVGVTFAIVGREIVLLRQRFIDEAQPFFFSKRNNSLMILGVLPHTPADKMGLQIGEIIIKVNGMNVENETEFYQALQRNSAHCKLEIIDENGEIRFAQRALYEGEHHELGLLFVQSERNWEELSKVTV